MYQLYHYMNVLLVAKLSNHTLTENILSSLLKLLRINFVDNMGV